MADRLGYLIGGVYGIVTIILGMNGDIPAMLLYLILISIVIITVIGSIYVNKSD